MKMYGIVEAKSIKGSCGSACDARKIAAVLARQRMKNSVRIFFLTVFEDDIDTLRPGRPNSKVRFVRTDQFRSDRISAADARLSHASLSFVSCEPALRFSDFSFFFNIDNQNSTCETRRGFRQDAVPNLCSDFFNLTQNRCTYSDRLECYVGKSKRENSPHSTNPDSSSPALGDGGDRYSGTG